jgi:hypothetical protein
MWLVFMCISIVDNVMTLRCTAEVMGHIAYICIISPRLASLCELIAVKIQAQMYVMAYTEWHIFWYSILDNKKKKYVLMLMCCTEKPRELQIVAYFSIELDH